jgi:hypothetical protein
MKKLLLILLCVPLLFSCGENNTKAFWTFDKDKKEEVEIEIFGKIEKDPLASDAQYGCCEEYRFTLINTSFNKSIKFTLEREWYNHIHSQEFYWFCDRKDCYTNKEQEDFRKKIDTTKQMTPFNREKNSVYVTLPPGGREILDINPSSDDADAGAGADWEDKCVCNKPNRWTRNTEPIVKNYTIVGRVIIEE